MHKHEFINRMDMLMATCGSHHSVLNEVLAFRLCEEDK
jgi:hypothetical protein